MKNVFVTVCCAAILGLGINSISLNCAATKPIAKVAPKSQTIKASEVKFVPRSASDADKMTLLKTVLPNAKLEALGVPIKLDVARPSIESVAGLDFLNVRIVGTSGNHASVDYHTKNQAGGEIVIWFKPLANKTYLIGCNVYGRGDFYMNAGAQGETKKHLEGDGIIMSVVKPNPEFVKQFVSLGAGKTSYLANWLFYGCEITPVNM